jgi:hypothetical protein
MTTYTYPPSTIPLLPGYLANLSPEEHADMPLLTQVPNIKFDIDKLQSEMFEIVKNYAPVYPELPFGDEKYKYGGWSLTNASGDWRDGWESGKGMKDGKWNRDLAREKGFKGQFGRFAHTIKTELYKGYLAEVVETFVDLGFYPVAVRLWDIPPGGHHIGPHTDSPVNNYSVRLHIPIVTNDESYHIWYSEPELKTHMIADGTAWLFKTNVMHDAFNNSPNLPRYHLIMEAWDTKGIVPGFKMNPEFHPLLLKFLKNDNPEPGDDCILKRVLS